MKACLRDVERLLAWDKELRDHVRDYSSRGRAQKNTDCVNFFDLKWLLFYEPESEESPLSMKGYEVATSNFGNTPWTMLYEYAQAQKLMMHVMRVSGAKDVIAGSLGLCEHALLFKKSAELASTFWNIALLYASKAEPSEYAVGKLFQVQRTEIHDSPHLVLHNVLCSFKIDKAFLITNNTEIPLSNDAGVVSTGANIFSFIHYGKVLSLPKFA